MNAPGHLRRTILLTGVAVLHALAAVGMVVLAGYLLPVNDVKLVVLGLAYAQATVAGAWAACGPGQLIVRMPLAIGWSILVGVAMLVQVGRPSNGEWLICLIFGGSPLVQLLLVTLCLWLVRVTFRLRLSWLADAASRRTNPTDYQFGIRQLLILTTGIAIFLGVGRWLAASFGADGAANVNAQIIATLSLVVACNSLFSIPLVIALLLPRYAVFGIVLSLAFGVLVTLIEDSGYHAIEGGGASPNGLFWYLNGTEYAWVFASLLAVRFAGYRLVRPAESHATN